MSSALDSFYQRHAGGRQQDQKQQDQKKQDQTTVGVKEPSNSQGSALQNFASKYAGTSPTSREPESNKAGRVQGARFVTPRSADPTGFKEFSQMSESDQKAYEQSVLSQTRLTKLFADSKPIEITSNGKPISLDMSKMDHNQIVALKNSLLHTKEYSKFINSLTKEQRAAIDKAGMINPEDALKDADRGTIARGFATVGDMVLGAGTAAIDIARYASEVSQTLTREALKGDIASAAKLGALPLTLLPETYIRTKESPQGYSDEHQAYWNAFVRQNIDPFVAGAEVSLAYTGGAIAGAAATALTEPVVAQAMPFLAPVQAAAKKWGVDKTIKNFREVNKVRAEDIITRYQNEEIDIDTAKAEMSQVLKDSKLYGTAGYWSDLVFADVADSGQNVGVAMAGMLADPINILPFSGPVKAMTLVKIATRPTAAALSTLSKGAKSADSTIKAARAARAKKAAEAPSKVKSVPAINKILKTIIDMTITATSVATGSLVWGLGGGVIGAWFARNYAGKAMRVLSKKLPAFKAAKKVDTASMPTETLLKLSKRAELAAEALKGAKGGGMFSNVAALTANAALINSAIEGFATFDTERTIEAAKMGAIMGGTIGTAALGVQRAASGRIVNRKAVLSEAQLNEIPPHMREEASAAIARMQDLLGDDVTIKFHKPEEFKKVVGSNQRGAYDPTTNTVHINSESPGSVVNHEVWHAVYDRLPTVEKVRLRRLVNDTMNPKDIEQFAKDYDVRVKKGGGESNLSAYKEWYKIKDKYANGGKNLSPEQIARDAEVYKRASAAMNNLIDEIIAKEVEGLSRFDLDRKGGLLKTLSPVQEAIRDIMTGSPLTSKASKAPISKALRTVGMGDAARILDNAAEHVNATDTPFTPTVENVKVLQDAFGDGWQNIINDINTNLHLSAESIAAIFNTIRQKPITQAIKSNVAVLNRLGWEDLAQTYRRIAEHKELFLDTAARERGFLNYDLLPDDVRKDVDAAYYKAVKPQLQILNAHFKKVYGSNTAFEVAINPTPENVKALGKYQKKAKKVIPGNKPETPVPTLPKEESPTTEASAASSGAKSTPVTRLDDLQTLVAQLDEVTESGSQTLGEAVAEAGRKPKEIESTPKPLTHLYDATNVAEVDKYVAERLRTLEGLYGKNSAQYKKGAKAIAMQASAKKRELNKTPTPKEKKSAKKKASTYYTGREVYTPDGTGKVVGVVFGKVKVQLPSGEVKTYTPKEIGTKAPTMDLQPKIRFAPYIPAEKAVEVGILDKNKVRLANSLKAKGVDNVTIFIKTGTFFGKDGHLRYEIPSDNMTIVRPDMSETSQRLIWEEGNPITEFITDANFNRQMSQILPGYENIVVKLSDLGNYGAYLDVNNPAAPILHIDTNVKNKRPYLVHELQHAIQEAYGWDKSTSPENVVRDMVKQNEITPQEAFAAYKYMQRDLAPDHKLFNNAEVIANEAYDRYSTLYAEVEARDASNRVDFNAHEIGTQVPEGIRFAPEGPKPYGDVVKTAMGFIAIGSDGLPVKINGNTVKPRRDAAAAGIDLRRSDEFSQAWFERAERESAQALNRYSPEEFTTSEEVVPGFNSGILRGLNSPQNQHLKIPYHAAINRILFNKDMTSKVAKYVAELTGLPIQAKAKVGSSAYVNNAGILELNPVNVVEFSGVANIKTMAEVHALLGGYLTKQEAVSGYGPSKGAGLQAVQFLKPTDSKTVMDALLASIVNRLGPEHAKSIGDIAMYTDPGVGFSLVDLGFNETLSANYVTIVKDIQQKLNAETKPFAAETIYYDNNWTTDTTGRQYTEEAGRALDRLRSENGLRSDDGRGIETDWLDDKFGREIDRTNKTFAQKLSTEADQITKYEPKELVQEIVAAFDADKPAIRMSPLAGRMLAETIVPADGLSKKDIFKAISGQEYVSIYAGDRTTNQPITVNIGGKKITYNTQGGPGYGTSDAGLKNGTAWASETDVVKRMLNTLENSPGKDGKYLATVMIMDKANAIHNTIGQKLLADHLKNIIATDPKSKILETINAKLKRKTQNSEILKTELVNQKIVDSTKTPTISDVIKGLQSDLSYKAAGAVKSMIPRVLRDQVASALNDPKYKDLPTGQVVTLLELDVRKTREHLNEHGTLPSTGNDAFTAGIFGRVLGELPTPIGAEHIVSTAHKGLLQDSGKPSIYPIQNSQPKVILEKFAKVLAENSNSAKAIKDAAKVDTTFISHKEHAQRRIVLMDQLTANKTKQNLANQRLKELEKDSGKNKTKIKDIKNKLEALEKERVKKAKELDELDPQLRIQDKTDNSLDLSNVS